MQTRRSFLRNAAILGPAAIIAGHSAWAADRIPLGVQLYTVRNVIDQGLPKVLDRIHSIGYQQVEAFSGLYNNSAAALRHMVAEAGLSMPSGHFDYNKLDSQFNYAKELGLEWIVCPAIDSSLWGSVEGFRTAAKKFNEWGRQAQQMGMRFAFHNHDYEFRPQQGGKTGYDVLVGETDPALVFFEVDCYWVAQAGHDPVRLMERLGKRVKLLHLKDRKAGFPPSYEMNQASAHFVPVGSGSLNWKAILAEGERLGVEHYFVEQDETAGSPFIALRESYQYLRSVT